MRLVKSSGQSRQYHLNQKEADILTGLLREFPFTDQGPARISRAQDSPDSQTEDRGKLLNESLAAHREELTAFARALLEPNHWKKSGAGQTLTLEAAARELLLQILNDVRLGCWHALGEPDSIEAPPPPASASAAAFRNLMDVAGYFEWNLLAGEE